MPLTCRCVHFRRLNVELLEDRRLLSAGFGDGSPGQDGSVRETHQENGIDDAGALRAPYESSAVVGDRAVRIMPLGDSITDGSYEHDTYRRMLWQMLEAGEYYVDFVGSRSENWGGPPPHDDFDPDHEGHGGWRADQILANIATWAAAYQPDIVLMHLGTNDTAQNQSVSSTIDELGLIIDTLRAVNPNVVVLTAQIIPLGPAIDPGVEPLNAEIPALVAAKNTPESPVILVDQWTGFNVWTDTFDGVHPNASGEMKMAEKWYDALGGMLVSGSIVVGRQVFYNNSTFDQGRQRDPGVLITEAGTGTPDFIEIQNLSDHTIDTTAWVVAANAAGNRNINDVHSIPWTLLAPMEADELLYRPDTTVDDIFWRLKDVGWVMIVDNEGSLIDFVAWGYDAEDLATMNVTVGEFSGNPADVGWGGPSVASDGALSSSLQRRTRLDRDSASDWTFNDAGTGGVPNEGLVLPPAPSDDDAIAPDKQPLRPGGQATFANYTNYARGINGIMVDIAGFPETITADDFAFAVGNDNNPANWQPAATPTVDVQPGTVTRVTITWPDNTIQNTWLQVTVLANDNTGLAADDVFYLGNLIAECTGDGRVDATDIFETRSNPRPFFDPATIDTLHDFNRDQRVNAVDTLIARNNQTWAGSELALIDLSVKRKVESGKRVGWVEARDPRVNWLYQFEQSTTRSSHQLTPAALAVDKLLSEPV